MGERRNIFRTVRNFLFSSVNKEFLTFLFFLALSGVFWLMMTLNETYEREIEVPVKLVGIPKNVVLTSSETDTIRVVLQDKGLQLIGYMYGENPPEITPSFGSYTRNDNYGSIPAAELQRLLTPRLAASTKIVSSKPESVEYFFNHGASKRVPVKWTGRVTPERLYFISSVEYFPDSVSVYAAEAMLDSITIALTEPLSRSGFRDTISMVASMQRTKGVKVVPDKVRVLFHTDVLTEEDIAGIPIEAINVPEGKTLRTFPSRVTVSFVTGVRRFKSLKPDDFTVVVDYEEVAKSHSEKCNVYLQTVPQGISRASIDIKQVDYLIEEQ